MSLADGEAAETPALATATPFELSQLADIRQRHHERYREREEQEEQGRVAKEQEDADAAIAEQLAREEEEERARQLAADEEYSRQLAEQLNPRGAGGASAGAINAPLDYSDSELAAHYQQLEDGEAEGYRAPMRTGYMERLIDAPQDFSRVLAALQARAQRGDGEAAREPMVSRASEEAPTQARWDDRVRRAAPVVSIATLIALGLLLAMQ
eukprot:TRINITY_DN108086_c0_g1_i1.p1 TRINITY_DN108086_c0_g1~~TRINITY_DN108086_c0_g1_i1.p1  ORF type:complete len:211 (+),score=56.78 TRINITY_DN108086_c0_g1_i1:77-709(+)